MNVFTQVEERIMVTRIWYAESSRAVLTGIEVRGI